MNAQQRKTKLSLAMAAALVATTSAMGATKSANIETKAAARGLTVTAAQTQAIAATAKQDFKSILNSRMSNVLGTGSAKASYMPNMNNIMAKLGPVCSVANEILAEARQASTWQMASAKLNDPQSLFAPGNTLAKGIEDAAKELLVGESEGLEKLHFAIAVNQAAEVSKEFVAVVQQNMTADATPLVGRVSFNFHSQLMKLIEFADVQLDRQYLIPYYQSCGMGPIVILPPGYPQPQHPHYSQSPQVNQHGAPIAGSHPSIIPIPNPGWGHGCGLQIVYVNQVKQLAVGFLELANSGNHWTGFANDKVQLTVLKSLAQAARTTLAMSEVYNPYYVGIIHALYRLEIQIGQALKIVNDNTSAAQYLKAQLLTQYQELTRILKQASDYMPHYSIVR